jgi:YHS domain-containing protein
MAGWIIRLILLFFIIRAVMRLVRGITEGMSVPRVEQPVAVPLARDPICGTFVVAAQALTSGTGAGTRFFCSEKCRRAYEVKLAR